MEAMNQLVVFTPDQPFPFDTRVWVMVDNTALSVQGSPIIETTFNIWTQADPTTGPPVLTAISGPTEGAALNVIFEASYTKELNAATVTPTSFQLLEDGVPIPAALTIAGSVIRLTPSQILEPFTSYQLVVTADILDLQGFPVPTMNLNFTTGEDVDFIQPEVTNISPLATQDKIPLNAQIRVQFSEPVNRRSVLDGLSLQADDHVYHHKSITFTNQDREVKIESQAPLLPQRLHTIHIDGVLDLAGNPISPSTATFTTDQAPDTTRPVLTFRIPDSQAPTAINTAVVLGFSDTLDLLSYSPDHVTLAREDTGLQVAATADINGSILTLTPEQPLDADTTYGVRYANLSNLTGDLASSSTFLFTTDQSMDVTAPQLLSAMPSDNSTNVYLNARPVLLFNEQIQTHQLDGVTLEREGVAIPINLMLKGHNTLLVVEPQAILAPFTIYELKLEGIKDLAGNQAAQQAIMFTTGGDVDTLQTQIVNKDPISYSRLPLNGSIYMRFNRPINPETTGPEFFSVSQNYRSVPANSSLSQDGLTLTITPEQDFEPGKEYRFFSDIFNLTGILSSHSFYFYTGYFPNNNPPFLESNWPEDGAVDVPTDTPIEFIFNEPILSTGVGNGSIQVLSNDQHVVGLFYFSSLGTRVTFHPLEPLQTGTVYTLVLDGVANLGNNIMPGMTLSFTTAAARSEDDR